MGNDGVFSGAVFPKDTGIACERQFEASDLEAAIGDPLVIEGRAFTQLSVDGLGFRIKNRSDHVTRYFPRAAVALDEFPDRSSNAMIAPNVAEGPFWVAQAGRRRRLLAMAGCAYVAHFSQEPQPGERELAEARQYVRDVQDGRIALPDEPEAGPLARVSYERSQTAGVVMDGATGVGVRARSAGIDTSAADEEARLARINAAPMYRDGEPIDKET